MSNNQKNYIKKLKLEKLLIEISQLTLILGFIFIWELLASKNIINTFIFSKPSNILNTIFDLFNNGSLVNHVLTTLNEIIISFILGITLGFLISIIMYEIPIIAKIIDPFLTIVNSMPKVALGPLIIIIFGANTKSIIIMALLINLIVSIMTIYEGFKNIDNNKLILFKTLHATKLQTLFRLIIPSSFNTIISSLKLNISMSLIGVIMGEFLVSKQGIGYLITYGTQVFNLDLVISGIIILIILSYILYKIILFIEKLYIKK